MKNKSTKLAHKWIQLLGGLSEFPESEIESTAEQVSDMFYYEILEGTSPLKNGLNREDLKSELRQMRLSADRWVSVVDWEGIVELYSVEDEEKPDTITYQIPSWALSYLINGDSSGIEREEDIKAVDDFCERERLSLDKGHWSLKTNEDGETEESYFSWTNDVTSLGDDVYNVDWVIMNSSEST